MTTRLLHMHDNYVREFDATVIEVRDDGVVLDQTAFYPEGGGQSGDRGTLTDGVHRATVTTTRKEKGTAVHVIEGGVPFTTGASVRGAVDWEWRYPCMRFHTAQHVLSRYLQLNYGLETVGNMIKPDRSRADYSPLEHFDEDMKRSVEEGVNEILLRGLDVEIRFMPREEAIAFLKEKGYQTRYLEMVPKSVSEFRVVLIGDYDAASCAGTHVRNTREIGTIRIGKTKNVGAGKRRIYFTLDPPR